MSSNPYLVKTYEVLSISLFFCKKNSKTPKVLLIYILYFEKKNKFPEKTFAFGCHNLDKSGSRKLVLKFLDRNRSSPFIGGRLRFFLVTFFYQRFCRRMESLF
mgnify:CR=1 FL=1